MQRYQGSKRPGAVKSPVLKKAWAYPAGLGENGIGFKEAVAGLMMFGLLSLAGSRTFRDVEAKRRIDVRNQAMTPVYTRMAEMEKTDRYRVKLAVAGFRAGLRSGRVSRGWSPASGQP